MASGIFDDALIKHLWSSDECRAIFCDENRVRKWYEFEAALAQANSLRPGQVLEQIPGLVVTQHSGDGKANQYFLRGYNLDHGTDFSTTVAGMPVNMPTHAHGHGYTDLNFLIAEDEDC